jgi:transposase-like protein
MRGVSARRVAEVLKRYGLHSARVSGRSVFRDVLGQLREVETRYGVDLNTSGKDNVRVVKGGWY